MTDIGYIQRAGTPADDKSGPRLDGGVTTWAHAVAGPLAGATCLWQDLDGLQVSPAPPRPPHTSILWAWTSDGTLHRVRLDGQTVYLASCRPTTTQDTLPWNPADGRVAGYRAATPGVGLGTAYTRILVYPERRDDGHGPVTFLRPVAATQAAGDG